MRKPYVDTHDKKFPARLRVWRTAAQFTQGQLAEAAQLSPGTIYQYERGSRTPTKGIQALLFTCCRERAEHFGIVLEN